MISYVVLPTLLLTEVNKLDKLSQVLNINGTGLYQKKLRLCPRYFMMISRLKLLFFVLLGKAKIIFSYL